MRYVLAALCLVTATSAEAQGTRRWLIRVEGGVAEIHRFAPERRGIVLGVRAARVWSDDLVRLDWGITGSRADQGFFSVDLGIELRLCRAQCRVVPYVTAAVGSLVEPIYDSSSTSRAGGGIDIRLDANQLLRVGICLGRHSRDARGPHSLTIGYSRRFGARK